MSIAATLILCLPNIFTGPARGNQPAIKIAAIFSYSGPLAEANVSIFSALSRRFVARCGNSDVLRAPTFLANDAVNLLADAITRAGTIQRSKIRDALADTPYFQGVTGTISFDDFGDPVKRVVRMKIQDVQRIYLKQVRPGSKT